MKCLDISFTICYISVKEIDMLLYFLLGVANADVSLAVKNKTTIEFDFEKDWIPYIAGEVAFVKKELTRNKFTIGTKYRANENIKLETHWFLQNNLLLKKKFRAWPWLENGR